MVFYNFATDLSDLHVESEAQKQCGACHVETITNVS